MTNVITPDFKAEEVKQELQVWVCGVCNNSTFLLFNDERVQCAYCETIICDDCTDREGWRKCLPLSPENAQETDAGVIRQHHTGSVEFARLRAFRAIEAWFKKGELEFIIGGDVKGATMSWFNVDTDKDRDYLLENLRGIVKHVEGLKFGTPEPNDNP